MRKTPSTARLRAGKCRVALAAAMLFVSAGCRSGDEAAERLEFWAIGSEGEQVQPLVAEFERLHPGIKVRVQQIPWSAAHEKLLTAFAGDSLPDLCQLGNTWVAEFNALGALEDLSDRVGPDQPIDPRDFFDGVWEGNLVDGRLRGVPWYVDTRVLFYRKDMLADAGFEGPPRTWDEWRTMLAKIQSRQPKGRYAMLLPINEWDQPVILGGQAGSPLLADDGRRGAFSEPEFRRAFEFYTSIHRDGYAPAIPNTLMPNVVQEFARGTFAFYMTGPWNVGEFRRRMPAGMEDCWTTAPLPAPDGAYPGSSMAGGCSLVVFRDSPRKDAAWQLIEYLLQPQQQTKFFAATGNLPPCRAAWDDPALAADEQLAGFRRQLDNVRALPPVPEWEQIATRVYHAGEAVARGREGIDEALAQLDREVDAILEKRRWMMDQHAAQLAEAN